MTTDEEGLPQCTNGVGPTVLVSVQRVDIPTKEVRSIQGCDRRKDLPVGGVGRIKDCRTQPVGVYDFVRSRVSQTLSDRV